MHGSRVEHLSHESVPIFSLVWIQSPHALNHTEYINIFVSIHTYIYIYARQSDIVLTEKKAWGDKDGIKGVPWVYISCIQKGRASPTHLPPPPIFNEHRPISTMLAM